MDTDMKPFLSSVTVQKWPDGVDPNTTEPEETIETQMWYENGEPVIDPVRVAELDASVAGGGTP